MKRKVLKIRVPSLELANSFAKAYMAKVGDGIINGYFHRDTHQLFGYKVIPFKETAKIKIFLDNNQCVLRPVE